MSEWREPAQGSLADPRVPLPAWPAPRTGTAAAHGTDTRYRYTGDPCRCKPCKEAHRAAMRAQRQARKARRT